MTALPVGVFYLLSIIATISPQGTQRPVLTMRPNKPVILKGTSVTLTCIINTTQSTFSRNNGNIPGMAMTQTTSTFKETRLGIQTYKCEFQGSPASNEIVVRVIATDPTVEITASKTTLLEGGSLQNTCTFWSSSAKTLAGFIFLSNSTVFSTLSTPVSKVTMTTAGIYRFGCTVKVAPYKRYPSNEVTVTVLPRTPTISAIPSTTHIDYRDRDNLTITCNSSSPGSHTYLIYKDNHPLKSSPNKDYIVKIDKSSKGTSSYRCKVKINGLVSGSSKSHIVTITGPHAVTPAPGQTHVQEGWGPWSDPCPSWLMSEGKFRNRTRHCLSNTHNITDCPGEYKDEIQCSDWRILWLIIIILILLILLALCCYFCGPTIYDVLRKTKWSEVPRQLTNAVVYCCCNIRGCCQTICYSCGSCYRYCCSNGICGCCRGKKDDQKSENWSDYFASFGENKENNKSGFCSCCRRCCCCKKKDIQREGSGSSGFSTLKFSIDEKKEVEDPFDFMSHSRKTTSTPVDKPKFILDKPEDIQPKPFQPKVNLTKPIPLNQRRPTNFKKTSIDSYHSREFSDITSNTRSINEGSTTTETTESSDLSGISARIYRV